MMDDFLEASALEGRLEKRASLEETITQRW